MAIIGVSGKIGSGKDLVGSIIQYLTISKKHNLDITYDKYLESIYPEVLNQTFKIVKFADKLKDIVCILLGCTREQLEDRVFKETELGEEWWYYTRYNIMYNYNDYKGDLSNMYLIKPTPRLLLQLVGTEYGRRIIHPNIWVNATMSDYKSPLEIKTNKDALKSGEDIIYKFDNNSTDLPNWIITDVRFPNEAKAITDKGGINIRLQRSETDLRTINQHESETALDNYKFDYVVANHGTIEELILIIKEILIKENII